MLTTLYRKFLEMSCCEFTKKNVAYRRQVTVLLLLLLLRRRRRR